MTSHHYPAQPGATPSLAYRIRTSRKAAGLTQAELAHVVRVSRSAVAQWETGRSGVAEQHRAALSLAINDDLTGAVFEKPLETVMQFAVRNLSVLAYAQGFTLWHYRGIGASLADLAADGFFNPAGDMLAAGDMILLTAGDGGRVLFVTHASEREPVTTAPLS